MRIKLVILALAVGVFPGSAADLTVAGPPASWRVSDGPESAGILLRSPESLTRVAVVHSDLTESKTRAHLPIAGLYLAPVKNECSGDVRSVDLPATVLMPARLCVDSSANGAFSGTIRIAAAGREPSTPISTTIYITSSRARWTGTLLLTAGALLAFFVTRIASNRIARAQALLPLALLRERLQPSIALLERSRQRFPLELQAMLHDAAELQSRLSETEAEASLFVPPRFPVLGPGALRTGEFSGFLATADTSVTLLGILTQTGVDAVLELDGSVSAGNARKALSEIEALWFARPVPAEAARKTREVIVALRSTLIVASAATVEVAGAQREFTVGRLFTEVRSFSTIAWSLLTLGTILAGWVTLIANNPGFGIPLDYVTCFTTGFAVPATAGVIASPMLSNSTGLAVSNLRRDF